MSGEQTGQAIGTSMTNAAFQASKVIELRLDTRPILDKLREFLSGKEERVVKQADGSITTIYEQTAKARMNDAGVASIVLCCELVFNSACVQGNYSDEMYRYDVSSLRKSLAKTLMLNIYAYSIDSREYEAIIDFIMSAARPFLSRLIQNKERESYAETMKIFESNTVQQKGKFAV